MRAQLRGVVNGADASASLAHPIVRDVLVLAAAYGASQPFLLALVIDFHSPLTCDGKALSLHTGHKIIVMFHLNAAAARWQETAHWLARVQWVSEAASWQMDHSPPAPRLPS